MLKSILEITTNIDSALRYLQQSDDSWESTVKGIILSGQLDNLNAQKLLRTKQEQAIKV